MSGECRRKHIHYSIGTQWFGEFSFQLPSGDRCVAPEKPTTSFDESLGNIRELRPHELVIHLLDDTPNRSGISGLLSFI